MSEVLRRLRGLQAAVDSDEPFGYVKDIFKEAADEIERLWTENAYLRALADHWKSEACRALDNAIREDDHMPLHETTFGYLNPSAEQKDKMLHLRAAAADYAEVLERELPDGPDKTFVLRSLRAVAMWANVCVTRQTDGTPRDREIDPAVKEYPMDHPAPGDLGSVPT